MCLKFEFREFEDILLEVLGEGIFILGRRLDSFINFFLILKYYIYYKFYVWFKKVDIRSKVMVRVVLVCGLFFERYC